MEMANRMGSRTSETGNVSLTSPVSRRRFGILFGSVQLIILAKEECDYTECSSSNLT